MKKRDLGNGNGDGNRHPNGRVRFLFLFTFLLWVVGAWRLYVLQIFGFEKWNALAESQHFMSQEVMPERGEILLRDGDGMYPIAVNREYPLLYVSPKSVTEPESLAEELSDITGVEREDVLAKLRKVDDPFEVVKRRLSDEEAERIRGLDIAGAFLLPEKWRYYPGGELASQVIGFVSPDDAGREKGRYGFESSWNETLSGEVGKVVQERDAAGRWLSISDRESVAATDGPDVVLTIDRVIQHEVEDILKAAIEKHRADHGTVIVVEPSTGKILAMASEPSFNLNEYAKVKPEDYGVFMNPAVSFSYEPGSVMKPITMAIGIDEGKVSPDMEYVDPCVIVESGYAIKNAEEKCYGRSTMTRVLEESINTGVIFVEKLIGNRRFAENLKKFGFGEKTGIDLPGELAGDIRNLENPTRNIEFFTASFGQGVTSTPLQMAMAYAALANDGILMKPQLIEKVFHHDGRIEEVMPTEVRRVVTDETAKLLGRMLRRVVTDGHGKRADVPGYLVGGKTGTAQVAKKGEKGYDEGLTVGTFVGYAPIDDPKYVVLVKIDNPKDVMWAESSAAPVFGEIMKFLLEYGKVEPTEAIQNAK